MATSGTYSLKLRHRTWFVRVYVPVALQATCGKREVYETLGTSDKRAAQMLAAGRAATILERIGATVSCDIPASDPSSITAVADRLRRNIAAGELRTGALIVEDENTGEPVELADCPAEAILSAAVDAHLDTLPPSQRSARTGAPLAPSAALADIVSDARRRVRDSEYRPLCEWVDAYLKAKAGGPRPLTPATIQAKRRVLEMFTAWAGGLTDPRNIDRKRALRYVDEVIKCRTCKAKTMIDEAANLTAFFSWLQDADHIQSNPFRKVAGRIEDGTRGTERPRRPWSDDEERALLSKALPRPTMSAAVLLALYSGARLEELTQLRVGDVDQQALTIRAGKTNSSVRVVPLHPMVAPLVLKFAASSTDGYLLSGEGATKNLALKRSHALSKDFGRWRRAHGLGDPAINFHTLRNTVITRLQVAEVPESSIALMVGHKVQTMTFGTYGGREWQLVHSAIQRLTHGAGVDRLAQDAVAAHPGNSTAGKARTRAAKAPARS